MGFINSIAVSCSTCDYSFRYLGGFLDQKSAHFREEFPQLAAGGEEKNGGTPKKEEENKELPYGPGPSLRPQSE